MSWEEESNIMTSTISKPPPVQDREAGKVSESTTCDGTDPSAAEIDHKEGVTES